MKRLHSRNHTAGITDAPLASSTLLLEQEGEARSGKQKGRSLCRERPFVNQSAVKP
jgi:hypothetical protein